MLHCFSAIHSSCLKVSASKGEEDAFLFFFPSVLICVCVNLCVPLRQDGHVLNEINMADPSAQQGQSIQGLY